MDNDVGFRYCQAGLRVLVGDISELRISEEFKHKEHATRNHHEGKVAKPWLRYRRGMVGRE